MLLANQGFGEIKRTRSKGDASPFFTITTNVFKLSVSQFIILQMALPRVLRGLPLDICWEPDRHWLNRWRTPTTQEILTHVEHHVYHNSTGAD